jgi:hypothetical protein
MTIWRTRVAGWIPKATNTYSEFLTVIDFPLRQRLQAPPPLSKLRYTCTVCLFSTNDTRVHKTKLLPKLHQHWTQYSLDDKQLP